MKAACRTWLVTGYVRLDCDHRTHDRYLELGARLMGIGLPTIAYHQPLHECWLARHHEANGTPVVPAGKDSLAYHCVQHEKTRWLAKAAKNLLWIALVVEPPPKEQLVQQRIGDDGFPMLDHGRSF